MVGNTDSSPPIQPRAPRTGNVINIGKFPSIEFTDEERLMFKAVPRSFESTLFLFQRFLYKSLKDPSYQSGTVLELGVARTRARLLQESNRTDKLSNLLVKGLRNPNVATLNIHVRNILTDELDYAEMSAEEALAHDGLIALEQASEYYGIPESTRYAMQVLTIAHYRPELLADMLWELTS